MARKQRTPGLAERRRLAEQERRRERITQRVASGVPITKVAVEEGLSRQRISQIIHEQGLRFELPRNVLTAREQAIEAVELYRDGFSTAEIAKRLGRDHLHLREVLRDNGVELPRLKKHATVPHGTQYAYNHYDCRCEACRAAQNRHIREWSNGPGKAVTQQRTREYVARYPERRKAWQAVYAAVKSGHLIRPDTCSCGRYARITAHHDDYARPLDVLWLCAVCHKARHEELVAQEAA